MTSNADHRIWQDVYYLPFDTMVLDVKLTTDSEGYREPAPSEVETMAFFAKSFQVAALVGTALALAGCGSVVTAEAASGGVGGGGAGATSGSGGGATSSGAGEPGPCKGAPQWAKGFGDPNYFDYGLDVAVDPHDCSVVVTGSFGGTIDLGGGPLTGDESSIFVAKFDAAGQHMWSHRYDHDVFQGSIFVAIGPKGEVALTGTFSGAVDFGGGLLDAPGPTGIFAVELNESGQHLWSRAFGGGDEHIATDVVVNADGDVVVGGFFRGAIVFDTDALSSAGGEEAFMVQFDPGGGVRWARRFGGPENERIYGVAAAANGGAFAAGRFSGSIDLGLTSQGGNDALVVKFDGQGDLLWSHTFGAPDEQMAFAVAASPDGGAVVSGDFYDGIDLGAGPVKSKGSFDAFVARLDDKGAVAWAKVFGGPGSDDARSVALDAAGNVLFTGGYSKSLDFGGGPLPSPVSSGAFVTVLGPDGEHRASRGYVASGQETVGFAIAVDPGGAALLTGIFMGTVDFGSGAIAAAGQYDVFLARIEP